MKTCSILLLLCCAIPAFALSGGMEKASVHAMRKVPCMESQSPSTGGGILSSIAGTGSGQNDCIEYEIRTEKVSYVIRPHRAVLLLLGGDVTIKLAGSELLMRTGDSPKDIRCSVLAMTLRSEAEKRERERERESSYQVPRRCFADSGKEILCPEDRDQIR